MDPFEPDERIAEIIYKLLAEEELSLPEKALLEEWLGRSETRRAWLKDILQYDTLTGMIRSNYQRDTEKAWQRLLELNGRTRKAPARSRVIAYLAAAAVLFGLIAGAYMYAGREQENILVAGNTEKPGAKAEGPLPGGNKALLVLADGTRIALDTAGTGTLAQQGNTRVVKTENGQLVYNPGSSRTSAPAPDDMLFNTISTPTGGQYRLVLPDGSKVWLNAASSIRFPAVFSGSSRNVIISGEAYFETAPDPRMPFTVTAAGMQVLVLGTSFNINAYNDESAIKTTLLKGSVKVSLGGHSALLKPGQQSVVPHSYGEGEKPVRIAETDTEQAVAWQKGMFSFKGTDIETIMRQVARWYNVEVIYKGVVRDRFIGEASRDGSLAELLNIMELTGKVKFKISGRQVTVIPVN